MTVRPNDPIERLAWIGEQQIKLDRMRSIALFDARLQGRLDDAITVSGLSRKRVLAETRRINELRGRAIRWMGN